MKAIAAALGLHLPSPDPLREFVTLGNPETVHEVDPRWGFGWRSWSAVTLCKRRVHERGRPVPRLVKNAPGVTCGRCRRGAVAVMLACGFVRLGEALARLNARR